MAELTIKDDEAERLARELADATGESVEQAVKAALRERLERAQQMDAAAKERRFQELVEILDEIQKDIVGPPIDLDEFLYDEHGLPK